MEEVVEAFEKYQGLVPLVYDVETMSLDEARPEDMQYAVYLKREADNVIAEKDKEIAKLKESIGNLLRSNPEQVQNEVIQKSLVYGDGFVPVEHAMRLVAEIRHNKYKRCLANAEACMHKRWRNDEGFDYARSTRHMNTWLSIAEKFKPNSTAQ